MLERTLHVGHATLHRWIAGRELRVRDAHITGESLRACMTWTPLENADVQDVQLGQTYRWTDAVTLLGHRDAVHEAVACGALKLADEKVSDRALESFCRRRAVQRLNCALIEPATYRWLVSEYRLPTFYVLLPANLGGNGRGRNRRRRFTDHRFIDGRSSQPAPTTIIVMQSSQLEPATVQRDVAADMDPSN